MCLNTIQPLKAVWQGVIGVLKYRLRASVIQSMGSMGIKFLHKALFLTLVLYIFVYLIIELGHIFHLETIT